MNQHPSSFESMVQRAQAVVCHQFHLLHGRALVVEGGHPAQNPGDGEGSREGGEHDKEVYLVLGFKGEPQKKGRHPCFG